MYEMLFAEVQNVIVGVSAAVALLLLYGAAYMIGWVLLKGASDRGKIVGLVGASLMAFVGFGKVAMSSGGKERYVYMFPYIFGFPVYVVVLSWAYDRFFLKIRRRLIPSLGHPPEQS